MRVLTSMRKKFPMSIARIILKGSGLPVKRGWDETIGTINRMTDDDDFSDRIDECEEAYAEALLCANKIVRIFDMDEGVMAAIRSSVEDFQPEDSNFTNDYPFCLQDEDLAAENSREIKLVTVEEWDHGTACVFCSKAYSEQRQRYESDDFDNDVADLFGGADEIIAIRRDALQLFHVVWIPDDENFVEVRVDAPKDVPTEVIHSIHRRLHEKFNALVGDTVLTLNVNVYPVIKNIYEADAEGSVVSMDFTTQTGSTKNEKMRQTGLDLRDELFHRGGCDAVNNQIDPFRISVRWDSERHGYVNRPEISLNSNFRTSLAPNPGLYEFTVSNAMCVEDYDFLVDKILEYK